MLFTKFEKIDQQSACQQAAEIYLYLKIIFILILMFIDKGQKSMFGLSTDLETANLHLSHPFADKKFKSLIIV